MFAVVLPLSPKNVNHWLGAVALDVIATSSFNGFVVNVMPAPATSVKVSNALSATTGLCPETATLVNALLVF